MTGDRRTGRGDAAGAVLYGVARFEPGVARRIREIVITFDSPDSADRFALEQGWGEDYQIAPLRFSIEELASAPAVGGFVYLDRVVGRAVPPRRGGAR